MFEFKDKTIDEFRSEVAAHLGKEITLRSGVKVKISAVSENGVHYLSAMTGNFSFKDNGEFDWDKGVKGIKMYGFVVEVCQEDKHGMTCTTPEMITVPYEMKYEKSILQIDYEGSILK